MSVIRTLTADPHGECRDRADALTGMLASLYTLACVGDYHELVDFVTRRRLDDRAIGKLLDRVDAAEHAQAGPWFLADPQTLAAMHYPADRGRQDRRECRRGRAGGEGRQGGSRRASRLAVREGWLWPLDWDDDLIDDPEHFRWARTSTGRRWAA